MIGLNTIIAFLLLVGGAFLLRAVVHARRRRLGRASRNGLGASVFLALGGLILAIVLNLYTYQRLTYEQPIATVVCSQSSKARFSVRLTQADHAEAQRFRMAGTSWQLSARVLKWRPWASLIGLDARYRLDRLAGRYESVSRARHAPRTIHDLGNKSPGLDVWAAIHWLNAWLPLVDTRYGSAVYMPLADGARYKVVLTQTGLVARPDNTKARRAVRQWSG